MNTQLSVPHIVIVGAGFGGLRAAHTFKDQPVQVTLVDRNNYHLFQPLLYQVATASLSADEIAQPVRAILGRQKNLTFRMAEVQGVDLERHALITADGEIAYDALILAAGGVTNTFGNESVARWSFGLKDLQDAESLRNHILRLCERAEQEPDEQVRRALLTFVVVGGGPSGVESAGALAELLHNVLPRDFPQLNWTEARVILLEAFDRLLPAMPAGLGAHTLNTLRRKGVDVRLGSAVDAGDGQSVTLKTGEIIPTHTLLWTAGIKAAPVYDSLPVERGAQGRVKVQPGLQVPGYPQVFVAGDAAYLTDDSGKPLPMVAQVAMQEGVHAAKNALRWLKGEVVLPFHYHDYGSMATIGRNQAVALIGPVQLRGLMAWLAWVAVHIFQLVGFRNRLMVMLDWAWNYLVYDRPVRVIHGLEGRRKKDIILTEASR